MIDKETVARIKDAANIVDVVGDYVQLTRRGANYMGLCPFHNERTPSFSVNPRRNFCYCFSCHKGGSPVNFIMEKEAVSYHDALLQLAAKYGIEVHEEEMTDEERERLNARESMFTANKWAMDYFASNLTDTPEGRDIGRAYFYSRGITDEAIRAFHLGYAVDRGDAMVEAARKAGYSADLLQQLGLLGRSRQGDRLYDRFRGRVIYPVFTTSGKVVAFGGRTLKKDDKAKYINSPESPIYRKSNELYGIFQAKSAIAKADKCFLVEGYMDVIGMWQAGLQNVVASSGTALTDGQIAAIHRFTSNVTLLYDGDNAGIHAALRGIDMLLSNKMNVKVLLLPGGHDPDSFAREKTPEEFRQYVEQHETDIIRFKTRVLLENSDNDPQKRTEAIHSIVTSLACIHDPIARNVYINECASRLNVPAEVIASETLREREKAVHNARRQRIYSQTGGGDVADVSDVSDVNGPVSAPGGGDRLTVKQPSPAQQSASRPAITAPVQRPDRVTMQIRQCERQVLTYCVRYGMLLFGSAMNPDEEASEMSIQQYVELETSQQEVKFTVPEYIRVFDEIRNLNEPFLKAYADFEAKVTAEMLAAENEQRSSLAGEALSLEELEAREKEIRAEAEARRDNRLFEFAITWLADYLASHEDDVVRRVSTELLQQPHQLSKVYSRHGMHVPDECERLSDLLPRAVNEWRDAVMMSRVQELRKRLADAAEKNEMEEMLSLQKQLSEIMRERSNTAKLIGDRIISPK